MKPAQRLDAIILAGGTAKRLSGASKADLNIGGMRLLDLVLEAVDLLRRYRQPAFRLGSNIVLAPSSVAVPIHTIRTMEDPPGSGPLAGIEAGLNMLPPPTPSDLVLVCAVDSPGIVKWAPDLLEAISCPNMNHLDGAITFGGKSKPFRQYLQGIYRRVSLLQVLHAAGELDNRSVRGVLHQLNLLEVAVDSKVCRDLDTPQDLSWWQRHIISSHLVD